MTKRKAGKAAQADVAATWNHILDAVSGSKSSLSIFSNVFAY